jgi:hypothetical protein
MIRHSLALDPIRLMCETEDLSEVECPGCHGHVAVHQPDVRLPDRLLGTCESCLAWFLIDAAAGVMVLLPDLASPADAPAALSLARCGADLSPGDPAGTSPGSPRSRGGLRRAIG